MIRKVTIAGLGLMGASLAKAIRKYTDCDVYGWNRTVAVTETAIAENVIIGKATDEVLADTDLLIVGLFPQSSIDYILKNVSKLKKGAIIVDIVGVKTTVIDAVEQVCKDSGIIFIGGHPMAGLEVAGYSNSIANLYENASMILVPTIASTDIEIEQMKEFFTCLGFGTIRVCTKEEHDEMIAYTSQLAHIVSNAFMQSPRSAKHQGFSAGSYKDMTRVATLNENVWSELFILNKKDIVKEIDVLLNNIQNLRDAIDKSDEEKLISLLKTGRERKELYK